MENSNSKKFYTYTSFRVLFFIFIYGFIFLTLFGALYYYTTQQQKKVHDSRNIDYANEIQYFLELKSEKFKSTAFDFSFWNEYIDYIYVNKEDKWFNENIATIIKSYGVDYIATYDENKNLVIDTSSTKINKFELVPRQALLLIDQKKLVKFHVKVPEGILEVHGATISTSDDSEKLKKGRGYFIICKLLDTEYYDSLKKISSSNINLSNDYKIDKINDYIIHNEFLKGYDGGKLQKIMFSRYFAINFNQTKIILFIIIICFIFSLLLSLIYFKYYMYNPLKLVTKTLERPKSASIKKLMKHSGEFNEIGQLFLENNVQKQHLILAKEKAEESDRLKSQFLENISHEIKTPMNAIIGFSELLNSGDINESDKTEYLNIISNSGKNLVNLIDEIIEMSKIDANQEKLVNQKFDLHEFLDGIESTIKYNLPKGKNILINKIIPENPVASSIISDQLKLKQILLNLIDNAVKFTDEGSVTFRYKVLPETNMIKFIVEDTGIGIDEEDQSNLFKRFRRSQSDKNINIAGLGLGLAICKAYVDMLHGEIWFQTKKNVGTAFYFTIPLVMHK